MLSFVHATASRDHAAFAMLQHHLPSCGNFVSFVVQPNHFDRWSSCRFEGDGIQGRRKFEMGFNALRQSPTLVAYHVPTINSCS